MQKYYLMHIMGLIYIRKTKSPMCQSFGIPFNEEHDHFIATDPDGVKANIVKVAIKTENSFAI